MQKIFKLLVVAALGVGAFWIWNNYDLIKDGIDSYVENGEFLTLETRFSPEQILEAHKNELLTSSSQTYQEPTMQFHPYLLMDVKYTQPNKKTREGTILWSMVDGEMILNTDNWEMTHGFEDAINANASRYDFLIMNALASNNGTLKREHLRNTLNVDAETLDPWLENAQRKHLVTLLGNEVKLHFQNPKILVAPQTRIDQWFVTKPYNHAQRVKKRYSRNQIEKVAHAAFGNDFSIRNTKEIFLPVYSIDVLNPDGSIRPNRFNAVTGERIYTRYLAQR